MSFISDHPIIWGLILSVIGGASGNIVADMVRHLFRDRSRGKILVSGRFTGSYPLELELKINVVNEGDAPLDHPVVEVLGVKTGDLSDRGSWNVSDTMMSKVYDGSIYPRTLGWFSYLHLKPSFWENAENVRIVLTSNDGGRDEFWIRSFHGYQFTTDPQQLHQHCL